MNKPIYNAGLAIAYISLVVLGLNWITSVAGPEDNLFIPIGMLAMLVLSVAIMGFLFFYQPVLLLLENKRKEAIRLFVSTVAIFAVLSISIVAISVLITVVVEGRI